MKCSEPLRYRRHRRVGQRIEVGTITESELRPETLLLDPNVRLGLGILLHCLILNALQVECTATFKHSWWFCGLPGKRPRERLWFAVRMWSHTKIKCINSFQLLAITFLHDCVFPITIITIYCTLYYYHRSGCRQATVSLSVSLPRSHYTVSLHAHPNERPLSHELWLMDKNAIARECTVLYDVVGRFLLALQQRDDQVKKSLCKRRLRREQLIEIQYANEMYDILCSASDFSSRPIKINFLHLFVALIQFPVVHNGMRLTEWVTDCLHT